MTVFCPVTVKEVLLQSFEAGKRIGFVPLLKGFLRLNTMAAELWTIKDGLHMTWSMGFKFVIWKLTHRLLWS